MSPRPAPDLDGKVVVLTGATSGIGLEAAGALAGLGAVLVLGGRDRVKLTGAADRVRRRSRSGEVHPLPLDLASFASIRAFAGEVLDRCDRVDVLVANAGLILDRRLLTHEGHEMTIGVNHLGHFLLVELLRERLVASAPARVVVVASAAHRFAGAGALMADPESAAGYVGFAAYAQSKLANVLHAAELARRLEGTGVTANSLHPGIVRTGFSRHGDDRAIGLLYTLGAPLMSSARRGARTTVHLASSPDVEGASGGYYVARRRATPSADARDETAARWLWEWSERAVAEG